ncbi:hypothetical protein TNCV_159051 [Trichonephila clavipes]|uniref:Uncharacterized protein n=1 Tax=Trichonephila clavipes TaxID=2585209 RepID=A0A8X6R475_TRICX|nr:hypothetical protein TNCV_159051 [Trichonephila clavipes]
MTQKPKSFGKPWDTLATVGSIPRHLGRAKAAARFLLTTGHDFLEVYLRWLGLAALRPFLNEWQPLAPMHWTRINTRLTTPSVGTGSLSVKWSINQAWALGK